MREPQPGEQQSLSQGDVPVLAQHCSQAALQRPVQPWGPVLERTRRSGLGLLQGPEPGLRLRQAEWRLAARPEPGLAPACWPGEAAQAAVQAQEPLQQGWAAAWGQAQAQRLPGHPRPAEAWAWVLQQQGPARARVQVSRSAAQQLAAPVEWEQGLLLRRCAPPLEPALVLAAAWQPQSGGLLLRAQRRKVRAPLTGY